MVRYEAERNELLESERAAREAAQRAGRAKDEFLAVLSHELRTPLNAVFGWARLLQSKQLPQEHVSRAMDAIVRNADAQVRLIDDLLDLSRIGSGKMQLSMERVELTEVRQGALDAIRPSADEKGIRVIVDVDDDAGVIMRLQQIMWNLLANAVKFTDRGGQILLRQHAVDGHVEIAVSDTGLGLAANLLPHVFDRFRQADGSSTRSYRGLGLGLALVKDLVQMHGGTVSAASAGAGQGSTFTVRLPMTPQLAATVAAAPTRPHLSEDMLRKIVRLDGLCVVVTDDDPDALTLAETILGTAGAVVKTCSAAAAAVKLVAELRPDVLVSDLEMPDQDGYALIAAVRLLPPTGGGVTPAIALSAYGRPQDRSRALAAGFNMHVPKPVDPGELTAIVASLAGRLPAGGDDAGHGRMPIGT
jgi:CheY-like chemotaxis protein/anti-sigma regulatory factor (Ser/Thr protein kinase)